MVGDVINVQTGYTLWNGTDEVVGVTGEKVLVVEVTKNGLASKSGISTIASKA